MSKKSKAKSKPKTKLKIKYFELNEDFKTKYPDITNIHTMGKVLVLEHYSGALIQSQYYDDDSIKTTNTLRTALKDNHAIKIEFDIDGFLRTFAQLLIRRILQEAQEEEKEKDEDEAMEQERRDEIQQAIEQLRQQHPNLTVEQWQLMLQQNHDNLYATVQKYMPEIWDGLDFVLSILRILNLHDCTQPFIGLLLGRPGSGKTVILSLFRDWYYAFYRDNFTPKAFETHTTSVDSKKELEDIDMLPQMKDQIFLTPELAPVFSKKEDELIEILGMIVRLADGEGYSSHSGAHGGREYRDIMFVWAGAAVDIPDKVYKILSTLGPKWYHFRLPFRDKTEQDLIDEAIESEDFGAKRQEIRKALFDYLMRFEIAPHSVMTDTETDDNSVARVKIKWDKQRDEYKAHEYIVKVAMLLTHLRCAVVTWEKYTHDEDLNYEASICEDPSRTRQVLYNLARGHALKTGRNYITSEDVSLVVKTVLSTAHIDRVAIFSLLISMPGGKLTTAQIMQFLNKSKHPALKTMTEFKAIGLVDMDDVDVKVRIRKSSGQEYDTTITTKQIILKEEFKWFLSEEFDRLREGFVATDNRAYMDIDKEQAKTETEHDNVTSDRTRAENSAGIVTIFWSVYEELERLERKDPSNHMSVDKETVNHNKLHEALLASGKFYGGEATQIIEDMVNAGRLEVVSFNTYRKKAV